jgi:hypothetical protein
LLTGYQAYQWTSLDFADYWAVVENGTPILKAYASSVPSVAGYKKMFNTDWYEADKAVYEIRTADELRGFALLAGGNSFKGKTVELKADINPNDKVVMVQAQEADAGIIGLSCMKLADALQRPTIVVKKIEKDGKALLSGSCRNFNNSPVSDLKAVITATRLFELCAGHSNAAGVQILPENFNAEKYYENTVGIFVNDDLYPVKVQLKAYGYQIEYLRSLPLHKSQRETASKYGEFCVFEYKLCLTPELSSQILAMGENVEVLEPIELREEIKRILTECLTRYE